jgi:predicted DNA-binding helix-hairpin-helix protein
MDSLGKLKFLSDASRFDLSCACGADDRDHRTRGDDGAWLYPVSLPNGGRSVILKTLISNVCVNDCLYCPYRSTVDGLRITIEPEAMAQLFMDYWQQRRVFGLFLSSGVVGCPDHSMALLNDTAAILRRKFHFRGYIHLKVIPGASDAAIEETLSLASAVSINIETPGERHFCRLSQKKNFEKDIIHPLKLISSMTGKGMRYERIKTTTQFIVGASDETDREIITYTAGLYDRLRMHRVYFSAYQTRSGALPPKTSDRAMPYKIGKDEAFIREHRIYQADFLIRKYKFSMHDFIFDPGGFFSLDADPKQVWADHHPETFPVVINSSDKLKLLRVPGLGPVTAGRVINLRKEGAIRSWESLGLSGKRLRMVKKYAVLR